MIGRGFAYRGPYSDCTEEEIIDRLYQHRGLVAVDTETVNTNDYTLVGIGLYVGEGEGFYFRAFPEPSPYLPIVLGILADRGITKIYHNGIGFDLEVLDKFAYEEGFDAPDDINYQDSELMAKVGGLPGGLQRIGEEWLEATDLFSIKDLFEEYNTNSMLDVPWERIAEKCLNDCRTTWQLYHYMEDRLNDRQRECYEVDRRLVPVLRRIQRKGLRLRQGVLEEYAGRLKRDILRLRRECELEGIENPGSPVQVGFVLASRGHILPFTKGARRQLRVDEEILERVAETDDLAQLVLDWRGRSKLLSTYIEPWIGKERAYTHFRLDLSTGRLASGKVNGWDEVNRNLQNIPPEVREVFGPDNGIWSWADHGQIELRTIAHISKDPVMLEAYKNNEDLHEVTARGCGVSRAIGKTFNFADAFGAHEKKLAKVTGLSIERVRGIKQAKDELYAGATRWKIRQMTQHNGEWVEDDWGRRMRLPELSHATETKKGYNPRAFEAYVNRCAINYPVQGTAAGIVKKGMLMIDEAGIDMRLQVHDEYLVDGPWEPDPMLAHIHPELYTPFELKQGIIWS